MRICPNDKFIEIFAQRFHYYEDPFYKFCALNLLLQDASYSLALTYLSCLFKFFSFAFYNINFWFKISKIYPKISHFSQISHSRGNTGYRYTGLLWPNLLLHTAQCPGASSQSTRADQQNENGLTYFMSQFGFVFSTIKQICNFLDRKTCISSFLIKKFDFCCIIHLSVVK